ncbi:MAG: flagellin, partial [Alphaproteobacteria bacterium]
FLDTDVAAESTSFATSQVQLQAGISVLAQANLLPQNLLKLIG